MAVYGHRLLCELALASIAINEEAGEQEAHEDPKDVHTGAYHCGHGTFLLWEPVRRHLGWSVIEKWLTERHDYLSDENECEVLV